MSPISGDVFSIEHGHPGIIFCIIQGGVGLRDDGYVRPRPLEKLLTYLLLSKVEKTNRTAHTSNLFLPK